MAFGEENSVVALLFQWLIKIFCGLIVVVYSSSGRYKYLVVDNKYFLKVTECLMQSLS